MDFVTNLKLIIEPDMQYFNKNVVYIIYIISWIRKKFKYFEYWWRVYEIKYAVYK